MKALHCILRCAMLIISCRVYPIFFTSDAMSRRQVFLGRPLFFFPCGFHVRVCLVVLDWGFLSVWPIKRRFLHFIKSVHSLYLSPLQKRTLKMFIFNNPMCILKSVWQPRTPSEHKLCTLMKMMTILVDHRACNADIWRKPEMFACFTGRFHEDIYK